ncbi:MAG: spore coat associated protein CotJA [Clostridia bacterium]|nr:spore coat associated protein CotJA [Clostridia bacterium]
MRRGAGRHVHCVTNNGFLDADTPVAMVYSPVQSWKDLYDPNTALTQGTIFKELDLPFYPTPCNKETKACRCK